MTVQELINELNKVENRDIDVQLYSYSDYNYEICGVDIIKDWNNKDSHIEINFDENSIK